MTNNLSLFIICLWTKITHDDAFRETSLDLIIVIKAISVKVMRTLAGGRGDLPDLKSEKNVSCNTQATILLSGNVWNYPEGTKHDFYFFFNPQTTGVASVFPVALQRSWKTSGPNCWVVQQKNSQDLFLGFNDHRKHNMRMRIGPVAVPCCPALLFPADSL